MDEATGCALDLGSGRVDGVPVEFVSDVVAKGSWPGLGTVHHTLVASFVYVFPPLLLERDDGC